MQPLDITLNGTTDVSSFVNLSNRYAFPIALRQGRATIDGKSLLGILSLNLARPITVEVYDPHCQDFLDALAPYVQ